MQGLIEGRIVHYVGNSGLHIPAIITRVHTPEGCVNLKLFEDNDLGSIWKTSATFSEDPAPGTWHWIEGSQESVIPQKRRGR